ncbi:MAG: class I SAM-dependent methyltransferase [Myxococcota bacterium]
MTRESNQPRPARPSRAHRDAEEGPSGEIPVARICALCEATDSTLVHVKRGYELRRCGSCGLVYVANPPASREIASLYSFEAGYHGELRDESGEFQEALRVARHDFELLRVRREPGRLLDVGCSVGFFLRVAREAGWEVCGLEVSADTSRIARERYGLDVRTGKLEDDGWDPESFDVVTLWDVIEHLPDPKAALAAVHRILKPKGLLVFETPNIDGAFPRLSRRLARPLGQWRHPEPPAHLFQFGTATARRLLETTGFELLETRHERIPIRYSFGRLRRWFRSPRRLVHALLFVPVALVGPLLASGDTVIYFARKASR